MPPQEFLPLTFGLSEPKPTQKTHSVQTQGSLLSRGFSAAVASSADVFYLPFLLPVLHLLVQSFLKKARYSLKAMIAEPGRLLQQARWVLCAKHYSQTKETQTIQMPTGDTNSISAEGLQFHISLTHHPFSLWVRLLSPISSR